ncbi:GNAT family N-acetyltransferase [Dyella telluris]|uniref:GNAT family N-acetyltransferase n=1 Tax=Dyella telluris TaxID=2763498 RepID=A0A7G8Q5K2_9GAMM|nr:GNAT family N-acetyltransferase [Dyella telluris]
MSPAIDYLNSRHALVPARSNERFVRPRLVEVAKPRGERVQAHDGRELYLRGIEPDDVAALKRQFARLSPEDIRRRFLHSMGELPDSLAYRLTHIDPALETAYVLMDETVRPAELRGVGRIFVDRSANNAEFSVLVEPEWTRQGLGALLMQRLVDDCRRRGLSEIWGYVLLENRPMLHLCKELGFVRRLSPDEPGTTLISLQL